MIIAIASSKRQILAFLARHKLAIDESAILELREEGKTISEISAALDISIATLARRIAELKYEKHVLTKYRELQGLQLTELQFRILQQITPEKLAKPSLLELVKAFAILYTVEKKFHVEPSVRFRGRLLDYLEEIERLEREATQ